MNNSSLGKTIDEIILKTKFDYENEDIKEIKEVIHQELDRTFESIYGYIVEEFPEVEEMSIESKFQDNVIVDMIIECMFEQGGDRFIEIIDRLDRETRISEILSESA